MGKYEVTQAQWQAVMLTSPARLNGVGDDHPVCDVSWDDCQTFIELLNGMRQGTFRLPTEAEWEYACRAGTDTRFGFGDALECADEGENYCPTMDESVWWKGNNTYSGNFSGVKEVGSKLPNPWGLYDMHGNLYEWCSDRWQYPYARSPQVDPQSTSDGPSCVIRGGYCYSDAQDCRSASRSRSAAGGHRHYIGLRVVREFSDVTPTPTPTPCEGIECITIDIPRFPVDAMPLEMVLIQPGTFTMGSPVDERGRQDDLEWLPHEVTITKPF